MAENLERSDSEFEAPKLLGIRIPEKIIDAIDAADAMRPSLYVPSIENVDEVTARRVAQQISGLSRGERQTRFKAVQEMFDGSEPQTES
jgi:hypothetical protein